MNDRRLTDSLAIIGIMVAVATATILTWMATAYGLSLMVDSHCYLGLARVISARFGIGPDYLLNENLLRELGQHYAYIIRQWPHFYAVLLSAAAVVLSTDPYAAGRWLHILFPVIGAGLIWLIVYRNRKSHLPAFVAVAVVLLSPSMLNLVYGVYSEVPFILFQLAALLAVNGYLKSGRYPALIMAVLFVALACITRYAGVVMAVALAATVWQANRERRLPRKLTLSLLCLGLSVLPLAVYMLYPVIAGQALEIGGRSFAWYWTPVKALIFFRNTLFAPFFYFMPFWIPKAGQYAFAVYTATAVAVLIVHRVGQQRQRPPQETVLQLQNFITLCLAGYFCLLFFYGLFFDPRAGFKGVPPRLLAPVFVWCVILTAIIGPSPGRGRPVCAFRFRPLFAYSFIAVLIVVYAVGAVHLTVRNRDTVRKENSHWQNTSVKRYVQNEIGDVPWIVTNMPGEVFHYWGMPAFLLPLHYDFINMRENTGFPEQMAQSRLLLHRHNGMVLYFNPYVYYHPQVAAQDAGLDECLTLLDLEITFRNETCVVLRPEADDNPRRQGPDD